MAKDALVSEELAKKFATEKDTPYTALGARRRARHHPGASTCATCAPSS